MALASLLVALCIPTIAIYALDAVKSSDATNVPLSPIFATAEIIFDLLFESIILGATASRTWLQVTVARKLGLSRQTLSHSLLSNGMRPPDRIRVFLLPSKTRVSYYMSTAFSTSIPVNLTNESLLAYSSCFSYLTSCYTISKLCQLGQNSAFSQAKLETQSDGHAPVNSFWSFVSGRRNWVACRAFHSRLSAPSTVLLTVHAGIEEDFGEPLVHPIHSMDPEELDKLSMSGNGRLVSEEIVLSEDCLNQAEALSGVGRTQQTKTRRGTEEE